MIIKEKKKVAILLLAREKGGVEGRFLVLLKYLLLNNAEKNIEIDFFISKSLYYQSDLHIIKNNSSNISVIVYGSTILKGNNKLSRYLDYLLFIFKSYFKRNSYNTVHFVSISSLIFFNFFLKSKTKIISFVNSSHITKNADLKSFKIISKHRVIMDCLDERIAQTLSNHKNFIKHDLLVSPCSFIDYTNTDCNWENKENIIAFCGRLIDIKGIEILLPALSDFIKNNPEYKILIMGRGDLQEEIKKHIEKNNLTGNVEVFYAQQPLDYLKRSKIFLSLQKFENYPSQSLLQAMASKNAIIATNVGLTKKIVNKENGILISYDSRELVDAVKELIKNNDKLKIIAENARKEVVNNHKVEKYFNYLLKLYNL